MRGVDERGQVQTRQDVMATCQQFQWSQGGTQQLTSWMGFHGCMSAIPMEPRSHTATHILDGISCMSAIRMEPRRHTATHTLDGISWLHVSNPNGAKEAHSNSQAGWDFMAACQQSQWSQGGTQQLTSWMVFHGCMSAIPMEPRRHTATHNLDRNFIAACQQFK